ncbi:MAG: cytochrome P450 [Pseudomonadota bacterium]
MTGFCPAYPKPLRSKASRLLMFFGARRSWLAGLYERSYSMKMGEVHLPGMDLYMVNEPALVREVLVDSAAQCPKHQLLAGSLRPLLGDSVFTTNGDVWKRQRQMINPAFEQARLNIAFPTMLAAAQDMVARLAPVPDGAAHDMEAEMTHVTADIIFRTIFSVPMSGEQSRAMFAAFATYQQGAPRIALPALFGLRWLTPWRQVRRNRQAALEIREALAALIRPRVEAHRTGQPQPEQDILAALLDARDADGAPFTFEALVDQTAMLFLAGHETSASALGWALHLMANAPAVQERMQDEVLAACGTLPPEPGHIRQLPLIRNVFREALRLFPPVGFIARETTQPRTMRDKRLPAGASLIISPWLIHRHRELWQRPDEFDPDRYENDASRDSLRDAFLPFGLGPRVCVGAAFALQEAALVLALLARNYRFAPVPGHVPQPVGRLTIRSANGILLRVFRRPPAQGGL